MSKNQINYILALATLVVVWLYLNTFIGGAIAKKNAGFGRMPVAGLEGTEAPYFPRNYRNRPSSRAAMPSMDELKKLMESRKSAVANTSTPRDIKAPVPVAAEQKKQ